jgi:hypothetical protein
MIKNVTTYNNQNCVVLLLKNSTKSILNRFVKEIGNILKKQKPIIMTSLQINNVGYVCKIHHHTFVTTM